MRNTLLLVTFFRNLLLNPVSDLEVLNTRLDFLDFVLDPKHKELIDDLQSNMRFLTRDLNVRGFFHTLGQLFIRYYIIIL